MGDPARHLKPCGAETSSTRTACTQVIDLKQLSRLFGAFPAGLSGRVAGAEAARRAGVAAGLAAVLLGASATAAAAEPHSAGSCAAASGEPAAVVAAEEAFARAARASLKDAFMGVLADDALILDPVPKPGRAVYAAAAASADRLEWYPTLAAVAAAGDLGFTTGPWRYSSADGARVLTGDYVTVWRREATCTWRVVFDGGVPHAPTDPPPPTLESAHTPAVRVAAPPANAVTRDAAAAAIADFERVAREDGIAAGLHTYGLDTGVRLLVRGEEPFEGTGPASAYLEAHRLKGDFVEQARGRSGDGGVVYTTGKLRSEKAATHAYLEIWEYDAAVANFGLRLLLLAALPPPSG